MNEHACVVFYDHDDGLGYCAVCGWEVPERPTTGSVHPLDMPGGTGPERIRKAIALDKGGYAPRASVMICDRRTTDVSEA